MCGGRARALPQSGTTAFANDMPIHPVFANLIDNAMKYGPSGGRIDLGARAAQRGIEFYVRDFGTGISSEHLPRLFERFYRVDKARSRESGGTGLGLAIAKHIMLAHSGSIRAESEIARGTTFLFTLPTVYSHLPVQKLSSKIHATLTTPPAEQLKLRRCCFGRSP